MTALRIFRWLPTKRAMLGLWTVVLWTLCGAANAAYPVQVSDGSGHVVQLAKKPQRIVVLGPALYAYMLVDLGAAERVVGITQSADNPVEVQSAQPLGQSLLPDVERIIKLQPDLVLGGTAATHKQLSSLGIACFAGGRSGMQGSQDVFALLRSVGLLVDGDSKLADRLIEQTQAEMTAIESKLHGSTKSRVAVLYAGPRGNLFAAGAETPEDELVERSAGQNVFGHLRHHKPVSVEELIRQQPDVILIDQNQLPLLTSQTVLQSVPAVRSRRVFGINAAVHGSSRLGVALKSYARLIHPGVLTP